MTTRETVWKRITTETEFRELVVGRTLCAGDMRFVISADHRIDGLVGGERLSGTWAWRDGYFCRSARADDVDLGRDCEIIEVSGELMRYRRDKGKGAAHVVRMGARQD